VIAEIEADEGAELDDLVVAVMLAQLVEKGGIDRVGIDRHQLAVAQRNLFRRGEAPALGIMVDAFVEQLFR
jgi:hypothetical protein